MAIQNIPVDIRNNQLYEYITTPQYDTTRLFRLELTKDGQPYYIMSDMGAMFSMKKPDGHIILNECETLDNYVFVHLTDQMVAVPGKSKIQIMLYKGNNVLSTISGFIIVTESTTESPGESTDEYTVFDQITQYETEAKSYFMGDTGTREGEDTDNIRYYYEISRGRTVGMLPKGTVTFEQLIALTPTTNDLYNVSNEFTTNNMFIDGAGNTYPAGTNVYYSIDDSKWICMTGLSVIGIKGVESSDYSNGYVVIRKEDVGLINGKNIRVSTTEPTHYERDVLNPDIWLKPYE